MTVHVSTSLGTPVEQPSPIGAEIRPVRTPPIVSICCITYNHAPFIRECLDGFLMQETTFPVEILIHDDASTDGTQDIIREYERKYPSLIKPIYQTENQYSRGRKPNINFNFPRAKGTYIALCDGDDYWTDPAQLQTQVDFLENNLEYVVCYHDARVIDKGGKVMAESRLFSHLKRDFTSEELMMAPWIVTSTRCFRNVLTRFPEEFEKTFNGDSFLTVMMGMHGKGKYLGSIRPVVYRKHPDSMWSSLAADEQVLRSFNSRLYMYQYLSRTAGRDIAVKFLFETVFPLAQRLYPNTNPLELRLRRVRESLTFRLGNIVLWPIKKALTVLRRR